MEIRHKILGIAILALGIGTAEAAAAQQEHGFPSLIVQTQNRAKPDHPPFTGRNPNQQGGQAGDWLRRYQNLPPQEQERLLNNDPQFQKLPLDRQSNLRDRLHDFNSLPSEKKQQVLDRMTKFENFPKEQREQLKILHEKMHQIPEGRRDIVRTAFRNLRDMSPQDRERVVNSDKFRSTFSEDERSLIKGLVDVHSQANALAAPPQSSNPAPNPNKGPR